ncbi:MAG: HAMP domain-containing histidine kinase [Anaerolineae bacterium]|nr:HAMP domain-containing histidine kinase [Anaerolineae bacterium]
MNVAGFPFLHNRRVVIAAGIVLIVLIGSADYLTGSELSFSVFYLIPIVMLTESVGSRAGIAASVASAIIWLLADLSSGRAYSSSAIPFWNGAVRLSFFLIVTVTLSSLRTARSQQEELSHFIVHDLRSPLSNVLTGLHYLLDMDDGSLDAGQQDLVRLGIASCNRMMSLINALLDVAKLEHGRMKLAVQETQVQALFDEALGQVSAMALHGKVNVTSEIDAGAETVLAESDATVRVLVNLISNALKYSPKNTVVTLRAAPAANQMVTFSVTDQGPGIPPEWKDRVFEKFAQVEARRQGLAVGSGLGLTFCRLAIEAQGGRIWLDSVVGQGTTMTFTLPGVPATAVVSEND